MTDHHQTKELPSPTHSCPHTHTSLTSVYTGFAEFTNVLRPDYADLLVCVTCFVTLTNEETNTEIPF